MAQVPVAVAKFLFNGMQLSDEKPLFHMQLKVPKQQSTMVG